MHKGTVSEMLTTGEIPGIDPNIKRLVAEVNKIPGLQTTGSCRGHKDALIYQCSEGEFLVTINVEWSTDGILSLERLVWAAFAGSLRDYGHVTIHSAPPYLNYPFKTLYFAWDGTGDPEKAADELAKCFAVERPPRVPRTRKRHVDQPDEIPENVIKIIDWLDGFAGITVRKWDPVMEDALSQSATEPIRVLVFEVGTTETARLALEFIAWLSHSVQNVILEVLVPKPDDPWGKEDVHQPATIFLFGVTQAKASEVVDQLHEMTYQYFRH